MSKITSALICISILLLISGCKRAEAESTVPVSLPVTENVVFETEPLLTSEREYGKVCLQLLPTELAVADGYCYYFTPEDQELWLREFEAVIEKADYEKHWQQGDSSSGIWICYQDESWQLLTSGELQASEFGRVSAENAKTLFDMCLDTVGNLNLPEPVRPEKILNIQSATLEWNGTYTVTDADELNALERWLGGSTEMRGGTNCPFKALLTLNLESGEVLTLVMASDSCCTWMSEGVFYQYGTSDNEEFFSLFTGE